MDKSCVHPLKASMSFSCRNARQYKDHKSSSCPVHQIQRYHSIKNNKADP
ncbi:hypothetical protein HanPSC8_Chr09g0404131 [Helianthus annuus]|nr:hypothetical protein HanPSC8_Chr09g0404131 [Helianthus annuus]